MCSSFAVISAHVTYFYTQFCLKSWGIIPPPDFELGGGDRSPLSPPTPTPLAQLRSNNVKKILQFCSDGKQPFCIVLFLLLKMWRSKYMQCTIISDCCNCQLKKYVITEYKIHTVSISFMPCWPWAMWSSNVNIASGYNMQTVHIHRLLYNYTDHIHLFFS